jgi:hypothetical protein
MKRTKNLAETRKRRRKYRKAAARRTRKGGTAPTPPSGNVPAVRKSMSEVTVTTSILSDGRVVNSTRETTASIADHFRQHMKEVDSTLEAINKSPTSDNPLTSKDFSIKIIKPI